MTIDYKIQFESPNLKKLISHFTVVDMHFHSCYSDGLNKIPRIAKKARLLGIGIAITDHNEIRGAIEMDRMKDILSIPGIELTAKEGTHLLVYFYSIKNLKLFYKKDVKPFMGSGVMSSLSLTMEELIRRARGYHCVIIFPHPYCAAYTGICNVQFSKDRLLNLYKMADGVEVINSGNISKWNLKCAVLGFNLNKSITGGSDGHSLRQMGKAVTYAKCENTRKAFLDAVKKQGCWVVGKEIDIFRKFTSNGLKLRSNIINYPELIEKNLRYSCAVINSKSKQISETVKRRINGSLKKAHP